MWAFAPRPAGRVAGAPYLNWEQRRWVGSEAGRLVLTENTLPCLDALRRSQPAPAPPGPTGYERNGPPTFSSVLRLGVAAKGEWSWTLPGVSFGRLPAQVLALRGTRSFGAPYITGQRCLVVSWWLPVLVFAALPSVRAWRWAVARRRERHTGLCPDCGYDVRATPGRCPECGTAATVDTGA
jgi:hypothetical protein